jgi:hypothetical protein
VVEQLAQVRLGLTLAGVGPKKEGNLLTRLGVSRVEEQISQQRLLSITKTTHRPLLITQ